MNTYYKNNNIELIHGECIESMNELIKQGVKFDAIITDPPYGNMKGAELDGWGDAKTNWDIAIEPHMLFETCNKLLRENGNLILFSQEPYTSELISKQNNNLPFLYRMIWLKDHFANALIAKKAPVSYYEDINVFCKKYDDDFSNELRKYSFKILEKLNITSKEINKELGHRKAEHFFYWNTLQFKLPTEDTYTELVNKFKIDEFSFFKDYKKLKELNKKYDKTFNLPSTNKYKSNVLNYKKDYEGLHPTQKPLLLIEDLIKTYTNEGNTILDFTCGSGTTLVAAQNLNRRCIGIELEEKYCEVAKIRLNTNLLHNCNIENEVI